MADTTTGPIAGAPATEDDEYEIVLPEGLEVAEPPGEPEAPAAKAADPAVAPAAPAAPPPKKFTALWDEVKQKRDAAVAVDRATAPRRIPLYDELDRAKFSAALGQKLPSKADLLKKLDKTLDGEAIQRRIDAGEITLGEVLGQVSAVVGQIRDAMGDLSESVSHGLHLAVNESVAVGDRVRAGAERSAYQREFTINEKLFAALTPEYPYIMRVAGIPDAVKVPTNEYGIPIGPPVDPVLHDLIYSDPEPLTKAYGIALAKLEAEGRLDAARAEFKQLQAAAAAPDAAPAVRPAISVAATSVAPAAARTAAEVTDVIDRAAAHTRRPASLARLAEPGPTTARYSRAQLLEMSHKNPNHLEKILAVNPNLAASLFGGGLW